MAMEKVIKGYGNTVSFITLYNLDGSGLLLVVRLAELVE